MIPICGAKLNWYFLLLCYLFGWLFFSLFLFDNCQKAKWLSWHFFVEVLPFMSLTWVQSIAHTFTVGLKIKKLI